jgi:hypothetical protein
MPADKEIMHLQEAGALRRPTLSLSFRTRRPAKPQACVSPILTPHELRCLVAEMVD